MVWPLFFMGLASSGWMFLFGVVAPCVACSGLSYFYHILTFGQSAFLHGFDWVHPWCCFMVEGWVTPHAFFASLGLPSAPTAGIYNGCCECLFH